jgi:tRNA(Ile)-lysidine synthase
LCADLGLNPVVDPSNDSPVHRRNRVRHELIALLNDIAARDIVPVLTRQADIMRLDNEALDTLAAAIDPTDARALATAPTALARRAIRSWIATTHPPDLGTVDRVLAVARGEATRCDLGGGRRIERTNMRLRIES